MVIIFGKSKDVELFRDFVSSPSNRKAQKAFTKVFGKELESSAIKLHQRLQTAKTAADYNSNFRTTANRIEIKQGTPDKDPIIFKTRINQSYRFFFNSYKEDDKRLLTSQEWKGQFKDIKKVLVIAINNHNYNL